MLGILGTLYTCAIKRTFLLLVATLVVATGLASPAAAARDRTLYLYYTHTKETAKITYKRNGRFDTKGLAQLNHFLRDWRRDEPTKMDPRLFDLIWEVYNEVGASKPIHVVSAYRSPKTNEMLRSRSSAVAKNSNHTRGLAMDFFIPGVSISKLRQVAMKKQMGGVGYYPTSGSPFVHLDTGSVRAWPRMTTAQLKKIFPKGKTLHIPSNGVPLSKAGYATAQAEYKRCKQVPCSGASSTRLASAAKKDTKSASSGSGRTLLDVLFGNNKDQVEVAKKPTSISTPVKVAALGQLPPKRPTSLPLTLEATQSPPAPLDAPGETESLFAVTPPIKPEAIQVATANLLEDEQAIEDLPSRFAVASIDPALITNPSRFAVDASSQANELPQVPMRPGTVPDTNAATALLAAYAPTPTSSSADAQKALEIILNRQNGAAEVQQRTAKQDPKSQFPANIKAALATASLHTDFSDFGSILRNVKSGNTKSAPSSTLVNIATRAGQFFEPESEDEFSFESDPNKLEQGRFAIMFEPDVGDLAPTSVLGNLTQLGFAPMAQPRAAPTIGFKTASTL
ncbi:DUF882 domain-containing protein [Maritalea porphyrae]|uniref:DUF882 domain-containing protein n=1 Tax=Maritalea porphyrae TaxID=880732 RepID=UPI003AFACAAE